MAQHRYNSNSTQKAELPKAKITKSSLKQVFTLLKYLNPYKLKFFTGLFFLICATVAQMIIPRQMGELIDAATYSLLHSNTDKIVEISSSLFYILLFVSVCSFFRVYLFVEVAEKSIAQIRKTVFEHVIKLPMFFFAQNKVGELNSRISSDLSLIQDSFASIFADIIRVIIVLLIGMVSLSFVSIKLTLFILSILPFITIIAIFFGRFIRKITRETQDKFAESLSIVEEALVGIANIKAFVSESFESKKYDSKLNDVIALALRGAKYRGLFIIFINIGMMGSIIGVAAYGAFLVNNKELSIGQLTSFILYAGFIGGAIGGFAELYAQFQRMIGASERVLNLLHESSEDIIIDKEVKDYIPSNVLSGNIKFENLTFSYPSRQDITVLNNISFEISNGQKVAIIGPSGAGKSTITSLLLRFYKESNGALLFDNVNANNISLQDIRSQVAIVPQDVLLFAGSIKENILYGKQNASDEELITVSKQANAHQFIMDFPEGYETIVGERGVKLSGGQRQRIAIARALLKNPKILVLDEATSALDSESERLVQEALEILMQNRTSIIIAHRLSTIYKADKIIVLEKGEIKEQGTHNELIKKEDSLYKYLLELQKYNEINNS